MNVSDLLQVFTPGSRVRARCHIFDATTDTEIVEGREGMVHCQEGALVRVSWDGSLCSIYTGANNLERICEPRSVGIPVGFYADARVLLEVVMEKILPRLEGRRLATGDVHRDVKEAEDATRALHNAAYSLRAMFSYLDEGGATAPTAPAPAGEDWRKDWPAGWPSCVSAAGCHDPGSFSFVWPGRGRSHACLTHTLHMLKIAEACGLDPKSLELTYLAGKLEP